MPTCSLKNRSARPMGSGWSSASGMVWTLARGDHRLAHLARRVARPDYVARQQAEEVLVLVDDWERC